MTEDKYIQQAKEIYEKRVKQEIEMIAYKLREEEEEKKLKAIQDKCPHENTSHTNHGYHEWCNDCGARL